MPGSFHAVFHRLPSPLPRAVPGQIPAVCPDWVEGWTQEEAASNGYFPPWGDPTLVPVAGFSDVEGFSPFHGPE